MTMRQQWTVVVAIILVLGTGLAFAANSMKDELFPVDVGAKAPDFRAKVLGANQFKTLADYKGKVLLVNVWATYCIPCRTEMPSLERLHKTYGDSGLSIVAVEIDPSVSDDSVRTFAKTYGITFEILRDTSHALEKSYQVTGYPETFIVGREGTIRRKWISADDWSSQGNRALIAQLLGLAIPRPAGDSGDAKQAAPLRGR
jgi:cytochrome c biogenesis protein CcmG, thiol:disulfide interchange protein DsbE